MPDSDKNVRRRTSKRGRAGLGSVITPARVSPGARIGLFDVPEEGHLFTV